MVDPNFYKNDQEYYEEYFRLTSMERSNILKVYSELKKEALRLLNKDLQERGHEGSIMGIDTYDDELWNYLEGEEKERFNKYSRFLDFKTGFKPHTENYVKKFKEFSMIKEGLRFNTTYLSLPSGEYNIKDVLEEVRQLEKDLRQWLLGGWKTVTAMDKEHKEIIPKMK